MDLLITSHRPNLSNSSLKVYLSALRKLNDNKPVQSITFLLDYNSIIEKLIPKSNNTKKSYLTAVGVALQAAQGKSNKVYVQLECCTTLPTTPGRISCNEASPCSRRPTGQSSTPCSPRRSTRRRKL